MSHDNLNTYPEWAAEGRQVRLGQKAARYLVVGLEGEEKYLAVFHLEQTEELQRADWDSGRLISAEERAALKNKKTGTAGRLKLWITYAAKNDPGAFKLDIWCGSQVNIIEKLKMNGYKFSGRSRKWVAYKDNPDKLITAMRDHYKFEVEVEQDDRETLAI